MNFDTISMNFYTSEIFFFTFISYTIFLDILLNFFLSISSLSVFFFVVNVESVKFWTFILWKRFFLNLSFINVQNFWENILSNSLKFWIFKSREFFLFQYSGRKRNINFCLQFRIHFLNSQRNFEKKRIKKIWQK